MPDGMGYEAFSVRAPDGSGKQRLQKCRQFPWSTLVRNLQDISIELNSERVHCHVEVEDIPPLGYKTYHLVRESRFDDVTAGLAPSAHVLENEHLRVEFNSNGTLRLTHKETGHTFSDLHCLEDTGETGHSWVHMEPDDNLTITSHGLPVSIELEEAGPLLARMRVDYHMQIPVGLDQDITAQFREAEMNHTSRTSECREMVVTSRFTLRAGQKRLDITTSLDNSCRNHRLRAVFPTHLVADKTDAETAFDVVSRDIHVKEGSAYYGRLNPQYPMYRFVDMSDGNMGLAILNTGIREYEAMDIPDRPIAITLLRAFTYRNCPIFGRWEVYPEMDLTQCLGHHEWTYAIYPHTGDWRNGVFQQTETLNLPLEAAQAGPHEGALPKTMSFLELAGDGLELTAFKRAEDRRNGYVVRLFNPTNDTITGRLRLFKDIKRAWLTNLNEKRRKELKPVGKTLRINAAPKKILTIEFQI
jgi:alpha-mannosidase